MNVVASEVQRTVRASSESGLSKEAAALAALIGALSYIRVEGLREDRLLAEAQRAVPVRYQQELIHSVAQ